MLKTSGNMTESIIEVRGWTNRRKYFRGCLYMCKCVVGGICEGVCLHAYVFDFQFVAGSQRGFDWSVAFNDSLAIIV